MLELMLTPRENTQLIHISISKCQIELTVHDLFRYKLHGRFNVCMVACLIIMGPILILMFSTTFRAYIVV